MPRAIFTFLTLAFLMSPQGFAATLVVVKGHAEHGSKERNADILPPLFDDIKTKAREAAVALLPALEGNDQWMRVLPWKLKSNCQRLRRSSEYCFSGYAQAEAGFMKASESTDTFWDINSRSTSLNHYFDERPFNSCPHFREDAVKNATKEALEQI